MYIHNSQGFEWDEDKNAYNKAKHGLDFQEALDFEWESAVFLDRSRSKDKETRYIAVNFFKGKLHTIVFTRRENLTRLISMRRSNAREEKDYEKANIETS